MNLWILPSRHLPQFNAPPSIVVGSNERIIDLSRAAAEDLAMMKAGVVKVLVEVLEKSN